MIKLIHLELNNFMSYKHAKIPLDDRGLCLIDGWNKDAFNSNGAGKSTIPSAITWCLFGRTLKGVQADDVVNDSEGGNCWVRLDLEVDEHEVSIIRGRRHPELGDGMSFCIGGNTTVGKVSEIQDLIINLLGMDFDTFVNTCVYAQDVVSLLGEATDAQRRFVFTKLLGLYKFDLAHMEATDRYRAIKRELDEMLGKRNTNKELLISHEENYESNIRRSETWENEREEKIRELNEEQSRLPKKVRIKGLAARYRKLNTVQVGPLEEKAAELRGNLAYWKDKITETEEAQLANYCNACDRPFSDEDMEKREVLHREDLEHKRTTYRRIKKNLEVANAKLKKAELMDQELLKLERQIDEAKAKNGRILQMEASIKKQLDYFRNRENPLEQTTAQLRITCDNLRHTIGDLDRSINDRRALLQYLETAALLFSKKGLPSNIIESSFGFIEAKANEYLGILAEGFFSVRINPERQLKSGDMKEEISLEIIGREGETRNYKNCSDGERQRINTAILFAINAYTRGRGNTGFIILDEVLDLSLDEAGQERTMELLRMISREVPTVLVISHKGGLRDLFDSVIQVVKENGLSCIGV